MPRPNIQVSVSTSPEIQEFSGILVCVFQGGLKKNQENKNQELVASYTIDIEDWNLL